MATSAETTPLLYPPAGAVQEEAPALRYPLRAMVVLMISSATSSFAYSANNAVFAMYYSDWLGFSDSYATAMLSTWILISTLVAPIGGALSDRFIGNYRTQLYSLFIWSFGCLLMVATVVDSLVALIGGAESGAVLAICAVSTVLQALGYGLLNPIQNVFVADQFTKQQALEQTTSFSVFYFFLNFGTLFGEFLGPLLRQSTTFMVTFVATTSSIIVATAVFFAGNRLYRHKPLKSNPDADKGLVARVKRDVLDIKHILKIFIPLPLFYALFYQQNSTWVFQAEDMNRVVGPIGKTPQFEIPPDMMPSLEDVSCLVLILCFDKLMYPAFARCGRPLRPLAKMGIGFLMVFLSFVMAGLVSVYMSFYPDDSVSVFWQVPQIVLMGCAEIMVVIPSFDFAYSQSPPRSRGTVNAIYQLTAAAGNLVVIVIALIPVDNAAAIFFLYAGMMSVVLLVFVLLVRFYEYVTFPEEDAEPGDGPPKLAATVAATLEGENAKTR